MAEIHVVIESINGPLIAGLVDFESLRTLSNALNGTEGQTRIYTFVVRDPTTGKETLVNSEACAKLYEH